MAQIRLDDFGVGYFIATHDSNSYRLFVGIRDCSHKIEYPPTQLRVEPHECLSHRKTIWGGNKFEQMSG